MSDFISTRCPSVSCQDTTLWSNASSCNPRARSHSNVQVDVPFCTTSRGYGLIRLDVVWSKLQIWVCVMTIPPAPGWIPGQAQRRGLWCTWNLIQSLGPTHTLMRSLAPIALIWDSRQPGSGDHHAYAPLLVVIGFWIWSRHWTYMKRLH